MKQLYATIILVLTCASYTATSQIPYWQWAKAPGGTGQWEYADGITKDANGYIYITGAYGNDIIFGNTTLTGEGVYTVKYDSSGNVIWAVAGTGQAVGLGITTDLSGNVYVTGAYDTSVTFGSYTLTNPTYGSSENVFFIVKYDSSGKVVWAKGSREPGVTDGGQNNDAGTSIGTDANGNVYVTGYFNSDSITFDNYTLLNPPNEFYGLSPENFFFVKYNSAGDVVWAQSGGPGGASNNLSAFSVLFGRINC